jgi:hypothetical protein
MIGVMDPSAPERALAAARTTLEDSGSPAFTAVALDPAGPVMPPFVFAALRPAAEAAGRLSGAHPGDPVLVVGCQRGRAEHQWTVYDASGQRRLLSRREEVEVPLRAIHGWV